MSTYSPKARARPVLLHGDITRNGTAWCAICCRCGYREHFSSHPYAENRARLSTGLGLLKQLAVVGRVVGQRTNIFADDPI